MTNRPALAAVTLALAFAMPTASRAGIVLEFEHRFPTDRAPLAASAQIEPDRLRIDFGNRTIIYREDRELLWLIEPSAGRYTELTKAHLKVLGDQIAALRTQLQERMNTMPPDQRAAVEQMVGGAGGGAAAGTPQIENTGRKETISGYACSGWEAHRPGGTAQQFWLADWKATGIQPADLQVLQRFGDFLGAMGPMAEKLSIGLAQKYEGPGALPGVPIRVVTPLGTGELVDEVKSLRRETIPADRFELPPGLTAAPVGGIAHRPGAAPSPPPGAPGTPATPPTVPAPAAPAAPPPPPPAPSAAPPAPQAAPSAPAPKAQAPAPSNK